MKKILYLMMALAAAMLSVSCTKEVADSPVDNVVTFEVNLESVATKAATIGDASHCDQLVYEVYNKNGEKIAGLSKTVDTNFPATVTLNLAKGQTYSVAFWAQKKGTGFYNTESLKNIVVNYEGASANDETRDAFYAFVEPFKVAGVFNHQVTLRRPFAQLNLAVADLDAVEAAAITLEEVAVTTTAATTLDLTTGMVSGEQPVEFSTAAVLQNATLGLEDGTAYPWIAMNYLLPNDVTTGAARTTETVSFVIATNMAPITLTSNSTPLQRNWRTNIIAKLTEVNSFNIVIDEKFDGGINIKDEEEPKFYSVTMGGKMYKTINEALAAAEDGAVISLGAGEYDLTASGALVKSAQTDASKLVISNGVTIQGADGVSAENVILNGPVELKSGNLKNLTLSGKYVADGRDLISSAFYGDCLVEDVIFNCPAEGTVNAFKEYSGSGDGKVYNLTFKNCTFNTNGQRPLQFDIMNVTVEGCTFDNPYRYCVQLGEYARGCNLVFRNNTVKNYGSTNKEFYTYVQIADMDGDENNDNRNNVVLLSGNTQSTTVEGAAAKWVDYYIENRVSNVKVTLDGREVLAEGVLYNPATKVAEITKSGADIDVALKKGATELRLVDGEYNLDTDFTQDVKFVGASKNTKIEYTKSIKANGAKVKFENLTLVGIQQNYQAIQHLGETVFDNCVIENQYTCYSQTSKTTFNNCKFVQTSSDWYNIWTYESDVDFNYCAFESAGKAALVYGDTKSGEWRTVNFDNCTFTASAVVAGKAAIEIDTKTKDCRRNVNINGCTAEGFGLGTVSGNSLFNLKLGEYGVNCNLTVDLADGVKFYNGVYEISNGKGLAWASTNVFTANVATVVDIMNDIDMTGITYTPATIPAAFTLNGNGKTISNLVVNGGNYAALLGKVAETCVVKDLTIKDSNLAADNNMDGEYAVGALIGWVYNHGGKNASLINCKSENVTYGSSKYVGGLVGYQTANRIEITNCSVTGMNITSEYTEDGGTVYKGHAGGAIGYFTAGEISGTSVQGTMTVKGDRAGGLVGSAQAGAVIGTGNTMDVTLNSMDAQVIGSVDNRTNKDNTGVTIL